MNGTRGQKKGMETGRKGSSRLQFPGYYELSTIEKTPIGSLIYVKENGRITVAVKTEDGTAPGYATLFKFSGRSKIPSVTETQFVMDWIRADHPCLILYSDIFLDTPIIGKPIYFGHEEAFGNMDFGTVFLQSGTYFMKVLVQNDENSPPRIGFLNFTDFSLGDSLESVDDGTERVLFKHWSLKFGEDGNDQDFFIWAD